MLRMVERECMVSVSQYTLKATSIIHMRVADISHEVEFGLPIFEYPAFLSLPSLWCLPKRGLAVLYCRIAHVLHVISLLYLDLPCE